MVSTLRKTLFVAALAASIALSACSASSASSTSGAPEADLFESQASSSSAFSATPAEASFSQSAEAVPEYYDTNTWNFTRLAHIDGATRESLIDAFGSADVDVTFSLEYVESD